MTGPALYLISPPALVLNDFLAQLEQAFVASKAVKAFQLRLKNASDDQLREAARAMLPLCRAHGVAFILNDRPDLAVECGMDGVHLGQEDMSVEDARKIVGSNLVIGVTCHASRHLAMEAAEQGADYVAFGAFYPTTSKPKEKIEKWGVPEPEILTWWSELTEIPCVAIGGVAQENAKTLVDAGADFIAAITSVWNNPQGVTAAVKAFDKVLV